MRVTTRRLSALAFAMAGLVAVSAPAQAQLWTGGVYTSDGSSLLFEYISREATFKHHLAIFELNGGTPAYFSGIFTAPPDAPGASTTVSGLTQDSKYVLGLFSPNAQSCFFVCANLPTVFFSNGTAWPWEIGGSSNFDFAFGPHGEIGIEDKRDGAFGNSDNDYNDMVIKVSSVTATPEPATLALMATGLLALGGMGVARRRRNEG